MKLFFVCDIHRSNVCFRKFLNALPIYGADYGVLLGDLTGKVLVPLMEKGSGQ
jgi:Icc-related predicted phosphoesterase